MNTDTCPCGTSESYDSCCGPFHSGAATAKTAEALMRSRYCAYVKGDISYLTQTLLPEQRATFSTKAAKDWSERVEWLGLEILRSKGGESDQKGEVEFVARYRENGEIQEHHEFSTFKKLAGRWYFADGKVQNAIPDAAVISRNALCPCGSGKKYKRCCADKAGKK